MKKLLYSLGLVAAFGAGYGSSYFDTLFNEEMPSEEVYSEVDFSNWPSPEFGEKGRRFRVASASLDEEGDFSKDLDSKVDLYWMDFYGAVPLRVEMKDGRRLILINESVNEGRITYYSE